MHVPVCSAANNQEQDNVTQPIDDCLSKSSCDDDPFLSILDDDSSDQKIIDDIEDPHNHKELDEDLDSVTIDTPIPPSS